MVEAAAAVVVVVVVAAAAAVVVVVELGLRLGLGLRSSPSPRAPFVASSSSRCVVTSQTSRAPDADKSLRPRPQGDQMRPTDRNLWVAGVPASVMHGL